MCSKAIYNSKNFLSYFFKEKNYVDYIQNGGAYMAEKYKIEKQLIKSKPNLVVSMDLINQFNNIDNKYSDTLNLLNQKRSSLTKTSPDFKSLAEEDLGDFKEVNLEKIENSFQTDLQKINQNNAKNIEKSAKNAQNIANNAELKKKELKEKALNNGWENSSIYEGGIQNIDEKTNEELGYIGQQASANSAAINLQKTLLEIEKENALKNFDIKYASKLDKQISSLKSAYLKKYGGTQIQTELNETINSIAEIEDKKRMEKARDLLNYVNGLKRQEALLFLANNKDELVNQVGKSWFNNVQNWIKARL